MLTLATPTILHELFTPSPGRLERTLQITAVTSIVVVIAMTFQIPDPALSTYIVFFVAKEDTGRSILFSIIFVFAILMVIGFLFLLVPMSLNYPSVRVLYIAGTSFAMFFLAKASKLAPLAGTLGLIMAAAFNAEQKAPIGEIATRGLLYVVLLATFPIGINIVFNIACGRHPERLLHRGIADRLDASSDALRRRTGTSGARLATLLSQGNVELATQLKMVALFHRLPRDTVSRLKALITLSYALLLAVAARQADGSLQETDDIRADRIDRLAQTIRDLPNAIAAAPADDSKEPDPAAIDLSGQISALLSKMRDVVSGAPLPKPSAKPAKKPKSGFFRPDAFSNPDYERFAGKATVAVLICYLTFNLLDWSGISTCLITCFIVALSTVGESAQKMTLRLTGCFFGAALGYAALVFALPFTTQITGLVVLIAVITVPAAWIAVGSPRIAYIGFQMAFAAYLCVLQGVEPKFDLTIARDRFIGILFGNVTVFVIFTQVYAASLLPSLTSQLVTIIDRCRDVMKSIAGGEAITTLAEQVAGVNTLVQHIDSEMIAYGFEKRPTPFGRLHLLSCRLIDKALHDVVADLGRLSAYPTPGGGNARDAFAARCSTADQRLEELLDALRRHTPLVGAAADVRQGDPSAATSAGSFAAFRSLHCHLDRLTVSAARYRRILRREAERPYA